MMALQSSDGLKIREDPVQKTKGAHLKKVINLGGYFSHE